MLPIGAESFSEGLRWGVETYHALKGQLKKSGYATGLGDEGGFAPDIATAREALDFIMRGDRRRRLRARPRHRARPRRRLDRVLQGRRLPVRGQGASAPPSCSRTTRASSPTTRSSRSRTRWPRTTGTATSPSPSPSARRCSSSATTCSSPTRSASPRALALGVANSILVKVNQIGTLTETLDAVALAQRAGYTAILSHRSGETEDTTIADLAVATDCRPDQDRCPGPLASASRSTTSCSASRRSSATPRSTRDARAFPALRLVDGAP